MHSGLVGFEVVRKGLWEWRGREHTHHEKVAPSHSDDTDVGEGFHDVIESGGGESMDILRSIGWDRVLCQLPETQPIKGVSTTSLPSTSPVQPPRVSVTLRTHQTTKEGGMP